MIKEIPTNISKRIFWRYVNKKINRMFHHFHVFNVINILFDEMIVDLKKGKVIKISNFGNLYLHYTKARKYFDVTTQQTEISTPNNILKFTLSEKVRKKLQKHLDIEKTFHHEQ